MAIVIYTSDHCPYCIRAKQLLDAKKAKYQLINVTNDQAQRELLAEKSNGLRTVPQIFIDDKHIGGYDALSQLNMQGKLDNLIRKHVEYA
jgi:glutaredoxin 3